MRWVKIVQWSANYEASASVDVMESVAKIGTPNASVGIGAGAPVALVAVREARNCSRERRLQNR